MLTIRYKQTCDLPQLRRTLYYWASKQYSHAKWTRWMDRMNNFWEKTSVHVNKSHKWTFYCIPHEKDSPMMTKDIVCDHDQMTAQCISSYIIYIWTELYLLYIYYTVYKNIQIVQNNFNHYFHFRCTKF